VSKNKVTNPDAENFIPILM